MGNGNLSKNNLKYKLKCVFNTFISGLKFRVKKCNAFNLNPQSGVYDVPCQKYPERASYTLCKEHFKLRSLHCDKYHFLNSNTSFGDMTEYDVAYVEKHMRVIYRERFNIQHGLWTRKMT